MIWNICSDIFLTDNLSFKGCSLFIELVWDGARSHWEAGIYHTYGKAQWEAAMGRLSGKLRSWYGRARWKARALISPNSSLGRRDFSQASCGRESYWPVNFNNKYIKDVFLFLKHAQHGWAHIHFLLLHFTFLGRVVRRICFPFVNLTEWGPGV